MSLKKVVEQQSEDTWAALNQKLMENDVNLENVLSKDLFKFLKNKATVNSTNIGYVLASLMTSVNFLLSRRKCQIELRNNFRLNLHTLWLFVGWPSTGKSPAIKLVKSKPMSNFELESLIISTTI